MLSIHVELEYVVKEARKKMNIEKAIGPDRIYIEVWKYLGNMGVPS